MGVIGRVVQVAGRIVCIYVSADVAAGNSGGMLIDEYDLISEFLSVSTHPFFAALVSSLDL